ncbi:MAG: 2-dehydro-3-deoxygalactonokinase [Pseudomonadota bacterium]
MKAEVSWIGVDWGTSRLRAWAMDGSNAIIAETQSDDGMGRLDKTQFELALLAQIADWLPEDRVTPVIACGMVGARQGWTEAAYVPVPTPALSARGFTAAPCQDPRITVWIIPGLKQLAPPDVIRGEETQIAGLLAERPAFTGTVCMPGTHSKWVQIEDGHVAAFQTCMTGEIFALLEQASILRHSVQAGDLDDAVFRSTVADALDNRGSVMSHLFAIRADDLLNGVPASAARARLSANLIASELQATAEFWRDQPVLLLGAQALVEHYAVALEVAGASCEIVDGRELTIAGLIAAQRLFAGAPHA